MIHFYNPLKSRYYPDPSLNTNCSEFEVNNSIISNFIIKELIPKVGVSPFPLSELSLMVASVSYFKPRFIFEWGTHIGKSALVFSVTSDFFKINSLIHSVDLPDDSDHIEHPKHQRGHLVKKCRNVILHQGDGIITSLELMKNLDSNNNLLFFVDGDHNYTSVKRELQLINENVSHPIILIHDTFFQSEDSNYNIGPYQAVNEFYEKNRSKFKKIETTTGLPGMTLLFNKKL